MGDIEPDTKDWTWTLRQPCPDCGVAAGEIEPSAVAGLVGAYTAPWPGVLERRDVRQRPDPHTWSALEYACHVRDVCRLFDGRVRLMLGEEDPLFENWDQDEAAVADRYGAQDPAVVAEELAEAAGRLAMTYAAVSGSQWERTGMRSTGARFTVLSLGQYGLHDLGHHLWDVGVEVPGR